MRYIRKTEDIFIIENKVGFDGSWQALPMFFKSREKRDAKIKELRQLAKDSPFGFLNHYRAITKRRKL